MKPLLRWYDLITVNIYFLGLTTVAQTNGLIFPLLIQQFVGEADKGASLGVLRLWSLMAALLLQAVWGILSDRSTFRFGRRRPYILGGTLASVVFFLAIGFSAGLSGMTGFWFLFIAAILMQISSNAGQAAQQAFIPDLVPGNQRGKFSSIKSIFELPLPLILVSFTIGRLISHGQMWAGIFVASSVLLVSMLIAMFVPEQPLKEAPAPFNWTPFLRLALMAGVFTSIILVVGGAVKFLGQWLTGLNSISLSITVMSAAGLVAMLVAVGLGVWLSVRLSIGASEARQNPAFTWWVINRLAFLVGAVNISVFAIYFLQARLGYVREKAAGPASLLLMVVGIFILLSALPAGWLADRFGRRQLVAFSGLLAAFGTLIALLLPNMALIYVGGCLIGIGAGFFYTVNWALGTDIVPREQAARYLGISNLAGAGAGAVGAYIGGPIADYFTSLSSVQGLGYVVLFAIYGALFLFSALTVSQIKKQPIPPPTA
jgi:MFS family permease